MPSNLPTAVLLDLDDTILDDTGCVERSWTDACQECSGTLDESHALRLREAIREIADWFWSDPDRHRIGRLDMKAARRHIAALALNAIGQPDDDLAELIARAYARYRDERIMLFPNAVETLQWFKSVGCALALVTNGSHKTQRLKISRFNLELFFDEIFVEGELGFGKPDLRVYELALQRLHRVASEVWMIGDNLEWDIAAPQKLGIYSVWVDVRGQGLPTGSTVRPDRIVRSVAELRDVAIV
jgi:putative hydrolase of the HAD superfamily